jgi:hypothetical protein
LIIQELVKSLEKLVMTEEIKPNGEAFTTAQPRIDTNQAGASEGYGEGAIQILEGLEAVRKRPGMTSATRLTVPACITWSSR